MAGDPSCWSHLFDDLDTHNSMTQKGNSNGSDLEKFFASNESRIQDELLDLLRIPSVSAKSEHNADTARAADWVKHTPDKNGVAPQIYPTAGHPTAVGAPRNAAAPPP